MSGSRYRPPIVVTCPQRCQPMLGGTKAQKSLRSCPPEGLLGVTTVWLRLAAVPSERVCRARAAAGCVPWADVPAREVRIGRTMGPADVGESRRGLEWSRTSPSSFLAATAR